MVELRFRADEHEAQASLLGDVADRVEVLPDRLLLYTGDGDALLAAVHRRGFTPESALRPSFDLGGRIPATDGSHPDRLSGCDSFRPSTTR